jgi:hypothetical protein
MPVEHDASFTNRGFPCCARVIHGSSVPYGRGTLT